MTMNSRSDFDPNLDEFQTASMAMNSRSEFDADLDEFQKVSMVMNLSDYADDYESDYDNYSMDSIDKAERRYLRFKDNWLDNRHHDD